MSPVFDENSEKSEEWTQDPPADPGLHTLLQSLKQEPPADYFEQFWTELQPQLTPAVSESWALRLLRQLKSPPALSVAAAVLVIALLIPTGVLKTGQPLLQAEAPTGVQEQTEAQSLDTSRAKTLPGGGRVAARNEGLIAQNQPLLEDANRVERDQDKAVTEEPMVLGAARQDLLAEDAKTKEERPAAPALKKDNQARKIPILQGYNQADYLVKSATLGVEVARLDQAFSSVSKLMTEHGGYIVSSEMSRPEEGTATARISLKVPKQHFLTVIEQIEKTGEVRSKQIRSEDLWLQLQRQKIEIDDLQTQVNENKENKAQQRALKRQLREQELQRQEFEQMLRMASLDLVLTQKAPSRFWSLGDVGEQLRVRLNRALQDTLRMLVNILVFLPPLLIYFGCAWLIWLLLKLVLVTRLELLSPRALSIAYLLGLLFFPLAMGGKDLFRATLLFAALLTAGVGIKTLLGRLRKPEPPAVAPADQEET
ncbi:hypothetical protein COW36_24675 [bacterium (Candidatus Blackallbacteria) CG17_big_fil_post_rev_8_21_14_2_50_48_46]|uniref:ACT domain-containing protein n=1 Tax=bacterium (Candidatus Blackallbacteria) CG17_big_fil_post_rev_8_21_14_2_50_48_46 TaxID=2014261 RepID=A0A2M7FXB5_9BACT|nr:MAG: hypothetical protein COW64_19615 [bacterium (Candidatus Blackallbacteria) CG18_big_fil_WC_8_21_14_2_50_49_26]PIW13864.1 MAG: hypothetical protein COW36_24675 [bacterium (Candidatus Blackallbacteria) CG17_big_fil_post_rev_8_21_14_2_50_48_46]PIW45090.1 MAG: hypothetical protein COW20_22305 [bacterium (Candidatus Blackallbacteria) CG13_big_fil_rev_8_21_14_2_50_49_14]